MADRLYKRGGVWWAWYYTRDRRRIRFSTRCTDKRAALGCLREHERQVWGAGATGLPADPGRAWSVHQATDYLIANITDRAPATVSLHDGKAGHLRRLLGRHDVNTLKMDDVRGYIATRLAERAAKETVRKELVTLRMALRMARETGRLDAEPEAIVPRYSVRYVPRDRWLTEQQARALLRRVHRPRRTWVVVALYTGARRSEIDRLDWRDVDLTRGWATLPGTKTSRARRVIPLPAPLRAALSRVPAAARVGPVAGAWGKVCRDLALACARAGVPRVSPNDLRRTYSSWLKQRGVDSAAVARLLGHTTSAMVERVYGHLSSATLRRAVAELPALPLAAPRRRVCRRRDSLKRLGR